MLAIVGGWLALFLACILAYWPGLEGPFVFDDFGSIGALGDLGGVKDWATFKAFVFGGHAGPTGRPLSLLTFLIDANNWPADPWPFKRTNLVIHLLNGILLGVLTVTILDLLQFEKQEARWIALISTACWLLHPFLVSTTLYAVQRMAQLSTLFVFAGLISYLYGRSLVATNAIKAYLIMSVSIGLFTFLAMISKENGILLPLLIGVVETTVVASQRQRIGALNRYWGILFIAVPSVVVAMYLGGRFLRDDFFDIVPPRDFSAYERVLTQPRVLIDYVKHWFIPSLYTTGVFQDHFVKSSGMLSPITTMLSTLLHIAVISIACVNRKKWPLFAFATLFFYASHVLESSVIKLELYFEHRNYLAAAFLFIPLIVMLHKKVSRRAFFVVVSCTLLVLAGFTRYSATVWADYPSMVAASAQKAPTSARAQAQQAVNLFNAQQYDEALQVIDRAIQNNANDRPLLLVNRLIILCNRGILAATDFEQVSTVLSLVPYDPRSIKVYTALASAVVEGRCPDVSTDALKAMFVDMLQLPYNGDAQSLGYSQIKYFVGFADVHRGEPSQAVRAFEESLQSRPGASHAMIMAAHLATGGYFDEALYFSDLALSQVGVNSQRVVQGLRVNESDIHEFRAVVLADKRAAQNDGEIQPRRE